MSKLTELLEQKGHLLADGATGTNLFDMGLVSGQAPEGWNFELPDNVRNLHRGFIEAGSDIIITNSFGASARRLHLHQLEDKVREINARAAELAAEQAANAGRPIVIGGSVGPTGDLFAPLGELTKEQAVEVFIEQIDGLKQGGADVAWIETMSAPEEVDAAIMAANEVGLPCTATVSFDTAGRSMMGLTPAGFGKEMAERENGPIAAGSNCGVGAADLVYALLSLVPAAGDMPVIAKANAGIPQIKGEDVVYSGTPELTADYAKLAINAGAKIIGGCCGSRAHHVAAMREAIDSHNGGDVPTLEEITETLGELQAPPAEAGAGSGRGDRRRRRRSA